MIRAQIEIIMKDCPEWFAATEVERMAFVSCMRMLDTQGRMYGFEPLRDAFVWFCDGFNSQDRTFRSQGG